MAQPTERELEAKFRISDGAQRDALLNAQHLGPAYRLESLQPRTLTDTYYDTPAYDLLRAGFALRLRVDGSSAHWGLKGLPGRPGATVHDRLEVEESVPCCEPLPGPDDLPEAIATLVENARADPARLMPIAELSQTRQRRHIVGAASPDHPLAELSIDRTDVYGPHDRPRMQPDGRAVAEFNEAEIELLDPAADAALHDLVAVAAAEFDLTPEPASKLERSLLAIGAHSPGSPPNQTGIVPDMHMADACRLIWREQLVRLICLEHGARLGVDPEYVHEMRVAIRRARAAGRLFGEYFRAKDLRRQMRGLRRLGRVLGAVRDLDVGIENLSLFRKSLPKGQRSGIKRLIQDLEEQRVAARMALLEYLDSPEHAKFVAGFDRFCRTAGAGVRPQDLVAQEVAPVQVRHTMPSIILAHFEAVRAYEVLFDVDPAPAEPAPVATLHALRIEAKYLRYSLEFVRHLLGAEGEKLIAQLKTLQDHLGDLNDADVERGRLFAMEGPLRSQQAVALRLEALEKVISHLREQAPARLDRFVAPTNRRRLAIAIARL